jgi:hypothetical protein
LPARSYHLPAVLSGSGFLSGAAFLWQQLSCGRSFLVAAVLPENSSPPFPAAPMLPECILHQAFFIFSV